MEQRVNTKAKTIITDN